MHGVRGLREQLPSLRHHPHAGRGLCGLHHQEMDQGETGYRLRRSQLLLMTGKALARGSGRHCSPPNLPGQNPMSFTSERDTC